MKLDGSLLIQKYQLLHFDSEIFTAFSMAKTYVVEIIHRES